MIFLGDEEKDVIALKVGFALSNILKTNWQGSYQSRWKISGQMLFSTDSILFVC